MLIALTLRMAASGRGCVKTRNRPLEIVSRLREFSVEVSCLLTGRYRLVGQSIASHVVFEGDFWGETVPEFSHSLGRFRPVKLFEIHRCERPLLGKAAVQDKVFEISGVTVRFTLGSGR